MIPWKLERQRIFWQGYRAQKEGYSWESNPYYPDDQGHLVWRDGYELGLHGLIVDIRYQSWPELDAVAAAPRRGAPRPASTNLVIL